MFVIIKDKKTPPKELKDQIVTNQIWLCSTSSGWMDRWSFLLWTICFCSWYTEYRSRMTSASLRDKPGLLILDGHSSRENPIALEIFMACGINVLVLPGHTTHVLNLFDVGLTGPLKDKFGKNLNRLKNDTTMFSEASEQANLRKIVVQAFIDAWNMTCTKTNCIAAARAVGLKPINRQAVTSNPFVRALTASEQERYNRIQQRKPTAP